MEIWLTFLNGRDIEELALSDSEALTAVADGLRAQGQGETVIEPRVHLIPDPALLGRAGERGIGQRLRFA